jgi:2TM family of unknown function (DUF5676)
MQTVESVRGAARAPNASRVPIVALGWSLSLFLALSFVLCVLLGLVVPDFGLHQPWLQFFPGFTWLTWPSILLGLVESFAYGWYVALIFGLLFNFFGARGW